MGGRSQDLLRAQAKAAGIQYSKYNTADLKALIAAAQTVKPEPEPEPVAAHTTYVSPRRGVTVNEAAWGSFESEVERQGPKKKVECPAAAMLNTLPEEGKRAVKAAITREEFSTAAICRALRARGVDINSKTLAEHRRGACKCRKSGAKK